MATDLETAIGLIAGLCTTAAFIPQVHKAWTTKDTHSISLEMFALFTFGIGLWLVYGIMIDSLPVILTNSITLVLAGAVLVMKLKFG